MILQPRLVVLGERQIVAVEVVENAELHHSSVTSIHTPHGIGHLEFAAGLPGEERLARLGLLAAAEPHRRDVGVHARRRLDVLP